MLVPGHDLAEERKPERAFGVRVELHWRKPRQVILPSVRADLAGAEVECAVLDVEQVQMAIEAVDRDRNARL